MTAIDSSDPSCRALNTSQTCSQILRGMSLKQIKIMLGSSFEEHRAQPFRAQQLYQWLYTHGVDSFSAMTNLPKSLVQWLESKTQIGTLEIVDIQGSDKGSQKVIFRLADGQLIESVLMRGEKLDEGSSGHKGSAIDPTRVSLCVSSQVGCAMQCAFCMTGLGGFVRNLKTYEIMSQALEIRNKLLKPDERIGHIVFMGMGEPMNNLEAVVASIRLLSDPDGFGLSRRRITVSTLGVVPGIKKFGIEKLGVGLAVSLNAVNQSLRDTLMPMAQAWPLDELFTALADYPLEPRRRITIEYILLRGINDTPFEARKLARLMDKLRVKYNLIMFNPHPDLPFEPVDQETLNAFVKVLSKEHCTVTVRWSQGRELAAACGHLAAHHRHLDQ